MTTSCDKKVLTHTESQQASLSVLVKFDQICKQNGFKYFLFYGTLIGAIRHNGFIPWDDDIDVMMPREDFDRFVEYSEKKSSELYPLKLHTRKNTLNYYYGIPRLSDMSYKYVDESSVKANFDIGAFIDIYPLDNYCDSMEKGHEIWLACNKINSNYSHYINKWVSNDGFIKRIVRLFYYLYLRIVKGQHYNNRIEKIIRTIVMSKTTSSDKFCGVVCWDSFQQYEKSKLMNFEVISHVFEGYQFNIPAAYDYILKTCYGDYMKLPPEEEQHATHSYILEIR